MCGVASLGKNHLKYLATETGKTASDSKMRGSGDEELTYYVNQRYLSCFMRLCVNTLAGSHLNREIEYFLWNNIRTAETQFIAEVMGFATAIVNSIALEE